jgi:hypothetical protein
MDMSELVKKILMSKEARSEANINAALVDSTNQLYIQWS